MDRIEVRISPMPERLMKSLGDDIQGGMRAGMINVVETVLARAVKKTPKRTSNLVNSEKTEVSADGGEGRVFTDDNAPYARYVHEGTGLFGPHKKRIVPVKAQALRIPGIGFRSSVKGMKGTPFFSMAVDEDPGPGELYEEGMMNYLRMKGWTG